MAGKDFIKGYIPYFPVYGKDTLYDSNKSHLIRDIEKLKQVFAAASSAKRFALDTETTGLNFARDRVVGFSFSFTPYEGYYVPVRHTVGRNIDNVDEAFKLLFEFMTGRTIIFHNAVFDLMMLRNEGLYTDSVKFVDTVELAYLQDSFLQDKKLKSIAKNFLKRDVIQFKDIVEDSAGQTDPELLCPYACADTMHTYAIFSLLLPTLNKECPYILTLDHRLIRSMVYYSSNPVTIDTGYASKLVQELRKEVYKVENTLFDEIIAGVPEEFSDHFPGFGNRLFNLDSRDKFAGYLAKMGVKFTEYTATGKIKTTEKVFKALDHPLIKLYIRRSKILKMITTYLEKFVITETGRSRYNVFGPASGRFSSGNRKRSAAKDKDKTVDENDYFLPLNFQNIPKAPTVFYKVLPEEFQGCDFKERKYGIVDYSFEEVSSAYMEEHPEFNYCEGATLKENLRNCVTVPDKDKYYFASFDYELQEYKVAGVLSKEPVFVKSFQNGLDLHLEMAKKIFGEERVEADRKGTRKNAKTANFLLIYLGHAKALSSQSGLPEEECQRIYDAYWKGVPFFKKWVDDSYTKMLSQDGTVYTYYGRPRRLKFFTQSSNKGYKGYAQRSVVSHQIQGTCADIMRRLMVTLYNDVFLNPANTDEIKFIGTIHDEVNFAIRKDVINKWTAYILNVMKVQEPGWPYPITASVELGYSYGLTWKFKYDAALDKIQPVIHKEAVV